MTKIELRVARIGNSRGVRLPATTLARYGIGERVLMEERADGILLRPARQTDAKLSWEETAAEMSRSDEDWASWDAAAADGLDAVPWDAKRSSRVAQPSSAYKARKGRGKKR